MIFMIRIAMTASRMNDFEFPLTALVGFIELWDKAAAYFPIHHVNLKRIVLVYGHISFVE